MVSDTASAAYPGDDLFCHRLGQRCLAWVALPHIGCKVDLGRHLHVSHGWEARWGPQPSTGHEPAAQPLCSGVDSRGVVGWTIMPMDTGSNPTQPVERGVELRWASSFSPNDVI